MNKNKRVDAFKVAKYFIWKSSQNRKKTKDDKIYKLGEKNNISNKKLQKLLYYAQVWHLVKHNKRLFPERIRAWIHGPVIPKVYEKYKAFGYNTIIDIDASKSIAFFNKKQRDLIDDIWDVYGKYSANYLELLSHSEIPWQYARRDIEPNKASSNIINLKIAKAFYKDLLEKKSK